MGYCLLFESMLDTVLLARDRFLKPGGAILPDIATFFLAGFGRAAGGLGFWDDVYGFDMSHIGRVVTETSRASSGARVTVGARRGSALDSTACVARGLTAACSRLGAVFT